MGYADAVIGIFGEHPTLYPRLRQLFRLWPGTLWLDGTHRLRMDWLTAYLGYSRKRDTPAFYAAMYLLTSNADIYSRTINCFCKQGFYHNYAKLRGISPHDYTLGNREQLMFAIDSILPKCKSWEDFIAELKSLGCEVKQGAHVAVQLPDAKRFARLSSLPAGYDENSIRARLSGEMKFEPKPLRETGAKAPQLLIDIQQKLNEGYGKGFENWAAVENIKRSAKTLIYIKDSGIDSYEELEEKCSSACGDVTVLRQKLKDIETQQKENREFQQQISNYGKTREIYKQYKASGWDANFYDQFCADIILHRTAKKYFNERGLKKLPSIKTLQAEWGELEKQKRPLYSEYKTANQKFKDLCIAKSNASRMLGLDKKRETSHGHGIEI